MIKNVDEYIIEFWNKNDFKIKDWYLKQKKEDDLIISASPYFLLIEITRRLKINNLIASNVNKKNGEFLSKNCYGEEKVKRFKEEYKGLKINNFYSDSLSDKPMMNIAKNSFLVDGCDIKKIL